MPDCKECRCSIDLEAQLHAELLAEEGDDSHTGLCCGCSNMSVPGATTAQEEISRLEDEVVEAQSRLRLFKQRWSN